MKNSSSIVVSVIAMLLSVIAIVMNIFGFGKKVDVEKALVEKPELVVEALQAYEVQQREQAMKAVEENLKEHADELYARADDVVIGNPEGTKVLVEFFDFSCGFCRRVLPSIETIIANNPDVKVVAKPLTFLSPASKYAAKVAVASAEQGKFAEVYKALFKNEGRLSESKIDEIAQAAGVDMVKLKEDMNSAKVEKTISDAASLASKVNVTGVPTMVFNNKLLQTLDPAVIQEAIDAAN
jgi:protein-disulfide isomerase